MRYRENRPQPQYKAECLQQRLFGSALQLLFLLSLVATAAAAAFALALDLALDLALLLALLFMILASPISCKTQFARI